jgi:hypothetical protein
MSWLARLKKNNLGTEMDPAKPAKTVFAVFAGSTLPPLQKNEGVSAAANDPAPDLDRWCWPHSSAMNTAEIKTFTARLLRFTSKGLPAPGSEALADKLVIRDREQDDRVICLECMHLGGYGVGSWRCVNWQAAGIAIRSRDVQLPSDLVVKLQRCGGFATVSGSIEK